MIIKKGQEKIQEFSVAFIRSQDKKSERWRFGDEYKAKSHY